VDQPHRRLVRGRAAAAERDVVQVLGREARELRGQLRRERVRRVDEGVVERESARLVGHRLRDLLAAVADVDAPQPADAVEVALAVGVGDVGAFAPGDDEGFAQFLARTVVPGVDVVVAILPEEIAGVVVELGSRMDGLRHGVLPLSMVVRDPSDTGRDTARLMASRPSVSGVDGGRVPKGGRVDRGAQDSSDVTRKR